MSLTTLATTRPGRAIQLLLVVTLALTGLILIHASPAFADDTTGCTFTSGKGGNIKRSEVLCRANYWYQHRYDSDMTYNQGLTHKDVLTGDAARNYRRDCSGFVDMAWHLNADPSTLDLVSPTYTTKLSSWKDLKPGDILDFPNPPGPQDGHAILFVGWENSAKTTFHYYSFGSTPVILKWSTLTGGGDALDGTPNKANDPGEIDGRSYQVYSAYRYKKIVDDGYPSGSAFCTYRASRATPEMFAPIPSLPPVRTVASGTSRVLFSDSTYTNGGVTYRRSIDGHDWFVSSHWGKVAGTCAV